MPRVAPIAGCEVQQLHDLQSSLSWRLSSPLRLLDWLTGGRIARGCGRLTKNRNITLGESATGIPHSAGDLRLVSTSTICLQRVLRPRCAAVVMVRDEADKAAVMMQHLCALFDTVVVLDHLSGDNTGKIAASHHGVSGATVITMRSTEPGHYQDEYMTSCARVLVEQDVCDWVFFFDADEFLPFASKDQFHQSLVRHANDDVIHYNWVNCFSDEPIRTVFSGGEVFMSSRASGWLKIALNANRLKGRECVVGGGHHAVNLDGSPDWQVGGYAGGLLHFPVVSAAQLRKKVGNGMSSYDARTASPELGWHFREIAASADAIEKDPTLLRLLALRYGEPLSEIIASRWATDCPLLQARKMRLRVALAEAPGSTATPELVSFDRGNLQNKLRTIFGATIKEQASKTPSAGPTRFDRLSHQGRFASPLPGEDSPVVSLSAAVQPLQVLVFSAWAGHEPFLFTLMDLMRPRRYVELGVHEGQSFFAACQHYESLGGYGEAVGIDLWEGDHQAGFYDDSIFTRFCSILAGNYAGCGRYLRSSFADAATIFDPESIDLLHIDGLHTYEAVAADYRTWRSKLTQDGVILLHDTSEFHSDFGVWQLMEEAKSEATEWFNFYHSHGLGVLAFGDERTSRAVRLLRYLKTNPVFFERYFALLGQAMHRSRQLDYVQAGDTRVLTPAV